MENESPLENEPHSAASRTPSWMKNAGIVVGVLALGSIMALLGNSPQQCGCIPSAAKSTRQAATPEGLHRTGRPRLLDLGAGKCIPCIKMTPILDDLKEEYGGRMDVEFIDVWKNRDAGSRYGIQSIPTQIFFDASGKELFRHEGFFAKEDILKKWRELGVDLIN